MNQHEPTNPESTESYTIAWICALEEEYFCAARMLDEELPGPEIAEDKDDNTYIYGRIAKHYVVIGCLPAGRYGTNSAARVARDMVRTFPHLRFALMVGIGGGAPTSQSDIRLGDVVVSQPKDGTGGVIQYDLGKTLQSGQFQRNGQLNAPPEKLLGAIPEMRRLYADKKKPDRLAEHLQRLDDMEDYQKPALDCLYAADYLHHDASGNNCDRCDAQSLVDRPARSNHRAISVHYGTIASGNSVVKDAKMRELYANDPELSILCFEMEAAGLMNNIPCLVIRGICDYCDSHKNDAWHNYAALTAAAYARELLLVLRSQRVDSMPRWADGVKQELQQVNDGLSNLNQKIDWDKLPIARDAAFDSYMDQSEDECLTGTRSELLSQIKEWSSSPQDKPIFWLNGRAGTGKSTISRTIARYFQKNKLLGASFFFKRGEGDRGTARKFFPTIIKQLVIPIPQLIPEIQKALDHESEIAGKSLEEQFDKLLFQPLQNLKVSDTRVIVIVLDALDEGEPDKEIRLLLQLLPRLKNTQSVSLRIFLTSRPEWPILQEFSKITSCEYRDLILHEVPAPVIQHDISLFLRHRLSVIRTDRSLPNDWPGDVNFKSLVDLSVPLFIFAATACRLFEDHHLDPDASLAEILAYKNDGSEFNATYRPILDRLLRGRNERRKRQLVQEFHNIVGVIVMLESPLSVVSLSKLLELPKEQIQITLGSFHSVLNIPQDLTRPVRMFHPSFRDFLLDSETRDQTPFGVDTREIHTTLAERCLLICQNLQKNICGLQSDGAQRAEVNRLTIDQCLPPELQYSCRYWAYHTAQGIESYNVRHSALLFLRKHFLHWVEAMSLLGLMSEVVGIISRLQSALQGVNSPLSEFLHDAECFVHENRQVADEAPLQLYCAGLIFAPKATIIRQEFQAELPPWIYQLPQVNEGWSEEIQSLVKPSSWNDIGWSAKIFNLGTPMCSSSEIGSVTSVIFSPDGRLLVSSSDQQSIRVWDSASGAPKQIFEGHSDSVCSVAFSPNSQLLVSTHYSGDITMWRWDLASGALKQTIKSRPSLARSVAFSPDSQLLACGFNDHTVQLWDLASGALKQILEGHSGPVCSVAFSPDGRLLASGSINDTVQLWDLASGELKETLEGHSFPIRSVAFSPDGQLLASSSDNRTLWPWDSASGALKQSDYPGFARLEAFLHKRWFSASASYKETVWLLWDPALGPLKQILKGHPDSVRAVACSPDRQLLAIGSDKPPMQLCWDQGSGALERTFENYSDYDNHIVRLWNMVPKELKLTLKGHSGFVRSLAFSRDGQLLASGSDDRTVRLWDLSSGELKQTSTLNAAVTRVEFSLDGSFLNTDLGSVPIHSPYMGPKIVIYWDWVELNGKKILWLPHEFWPTASAVNGSLLALGHKSGKVTFLGFRV